MENKVYVQLDIAGFLKALAEGSIDTRICKSTVTLILAENLKENESINVITHKSN